MSAQTYRTEHGSQEQQTEVTQTPVSGFSQGVDPAAQDQMWESRRAELVGDWLKVDPVTQATVCDEMGISHVINQGMLPHPSQIAQMVKRSHQLLARHGRDAEQSDEVPLVDAKALWVTSKARSQEASSRYKSYEQEMGNMPWGWAETQTSEWFGGQELPDVALEQSANEAIARLDALIQQTNPPTLDEITQRMALVRSTVDAWTHAMQEYTESRESGGERSVEALRFTRDTAADTVGVLAAPMGAGLVAGAAIGTGAAVGFQGVTELAAMEAGVQDEGAAQRMAMAGAKSATLGLAAGPIAQGAMSLLSARFLPRLVASASSILGRVLSEKLANDVVEKSIEIVVGVGLGEATPWLSEQAQPSIEELAAHVDEVWGQAIVAQALSLADEQEESAAA